MQKTVTIGDKELLMVVVEKGAKRFVIDEQPVLRCFRSKYESSWITDVSIPPGQYSILCLASAATEEQARGIVETFRVGYKSYVNDVMKNIPFTYALESLHSLVRANGFEPGECLLLLKKE